jgi:3-methyladenine DNA glycosylase AlkC
MIDVLVKSLPEPLDPKKTDNDFGEFIYASYSNFISFYCCGEPYLEVSLNALKEITKRFSAEYALRKFLICYPYETYPVLLKWTKDKNYHVRRLASEGSRPYLPWGQAIGLNEEESIKILNNLYYDKTRYVTRSVANHLNDIARIHPNVVIDLIKKWKASGKQSESEMEFITKHALRNQIKEGNKEALHLIGIGNEKGISIQDLRFDKVVKINTALTFEFSLKSTVRKEVFINFKIWFKSQYTNRFYYKIYKIKQLDLKRGAVQKFAKKHMFKSDMSTRTYNPGMHKIEIQINGSVVAEFEFELID